VIVDGCFTVRTNSHSPSTARPRFGAGASTAIIAALFVWVLVIPTPLLGLLPMDYFGTTARFHSIDERRGFGLIGNFLRHCRDVFGTSNPIRTNTPECVLGKYEASVASESPFDQLACTYRAFKQQTDDIPKARNIVRMENIFE
jgi:hypothetical protein